MRKKATAKEELPPSNNSGVRHNVLVLDAEQEKIVQFQGKCRRPRRAFNQCEVIRAGIYALEELTPEQLKKVVDSVPQL